VALVLVPVAGMVGYHWIEGWHWFDALYMTVLSVSTVGFAEVHPLSTSGRVFTIGLIAAGGALAAYSFGSLAEFIISGEWREHWLQERQMRMLKKLEQHIIVGGCGRVGQSVVAELKSEGVPFVVLERDPARVELMRQQECLVIHGDAAHEVGLREAGIDRARGLVAAAGTDAENVFMVLTARSLREDLPIVARAEAEESEPKLIRAGATRVIFPYRSAARRIATLLVRPEVADFLEDVSHSYGLDLIVEQIAVEPGSSLAGRGWAEVVQSLAPDVTLLACRHPDGHLERRPRQVPVLAPGMRLVVFGTPLDLQPLLRASRGAAAGSTE
jgi:voltage-gated potassium channel